MKIKELIKKGESQTLEFKSSLSDLDRLIQEVCGFANTEGGRILVGVSDSGKVLGADIGKRTIEHLTSKINTSLDPKIYPKIEEIKIGDKHILSIEVDESLHKPHLAFGKAYRRVGKSTVQISRDELEKMILQKHREKIQFDAQICRDAKIEDLDDEKLMWFLKEAKSRRGLKIPENSPINEALMRLKLSLNKRLTNAAILLFGKDPQKFFLQAEVRGIRFKGTKPVKPFIDMKVFDGNIIDQVDKALNFVLDHTPMAAWLEPGNVQRKEKYAYPEEAVREAIVNAICHRDYESPSKAQIRIFDDRVEVWNPGKLLHPLTIEDLKREHPSVPRNPLIAKQFFWIKYIEEVGTGTNDMIDLCSNWGLPEPNFEETARSFVVTFRKSRLTEEFLKTLELNERQRKAVDYTKEKGEINNTTYRKINNIGKVTAARELNELVTKSVLKAIGKGRATRYVLNE